MGVTIDGRAVANGLKAKLSQTVAQIKSAGLRPPALAVVLVGNDPASEVYVGHKEKACRAVGIRSLTHRLPAHCTEQEVLALIGTLNADTEVDGILVQLPLPAPINRFRIVREIAAWKDVDGLGPQNQGLLALGLAGFVPCTPLGVMELLRACSCELEGKLAVVIGRSILVGSPMVRLLTQANATVLNIHSRTVEPAGLCRQGDVVVVAAGVPHLVDSRWIKEGAVVIDVGMHRQGSSLTGDVDFASVAPRARYITPVPGGVGPMTIACLLANCVKAYQWRQEGYKTYGC